MKYQRSKNDIGVIIVDGATYNEKLHDTFGCVSCGVEFKDKDEVIVVPFLNTAFCKKCADEVLEDLKTKGEDEAIHQQRQEAYFSQRLNR